MSEAFLKAISWYILVAAVVVGASAFIIANNTHSVRPIMIGILSFGIVYGMSIYWKEYSSKIHFISIVVFILLSFASPYVPITMYVLFAFNPAIFDPYYTWAGTLGILGVPVMTLVFYKID